MPFFSPSWSCPIPFSEGPSKLSTGIYSAIPCLILNTVIEVQLSCIIHYSPLAFFLCLLSPTVLSCSIHYSLLSSLPVCSLLQSCLLPFIIPALSSLPVCSLLSCPIPFIIPLSLLSLSALSYVHSCPIPFVLLPENLRAHLQLSV